MIYFFIFNYIREKEDIEKLLMQKLDNLIQKSLELEQILISEKEELKTKLRGLTLTLCD